MRARRLLTVIWPSPFSSADAVPSLSSQSLPPTWAADLQKEVALLRRELHAKHAPSTTPSLPSTAPADARCFLSSPGDLLFQEHGPLAFAVPDHLGSFGGTAPLHGKSALPAVFPPARVETLSSTHDASGPSSLKINVQPPSTTVNSQQRAKKQRAAQRQQQSPPAAESSTSDLVSAVTAATSPAGFATGDPPTAVVALDSYRSLRDLIERSLPPTPPSESGSLLGAHALPPAAPAPGAQSAAGSPPPRPPTVASTILSDPSYPRLPDPRPWDLLTAVRPARPLLALVALADRRRFLSAAVLMGHLLGGGVVYDDARGHVARQAGCARPSSPSHLLLSARADLPSSGRPPQSTRSRSPSGRR